MGRKAVVPAAVADALTAERPAANASRAVSVLAGEPPDELANKDADTLAAEILALQIQGNRVLLAIGRRLIAAKDKLSHGDWLPWLESVNIPPRLAQRYMKLAREWSANASLLSDLGMTKALILLSLPEEAQGEFVAETHVVDGEEKSVTDMTAKELADAIQARKDAETELAVVRRQLDEAERVRDELKADADRADGELTLARQRLELEHANMEKALAERDAETKKRIAATDELAALKNKPVETVADAAALEQAREEVRKKMQSDLDSARTEAATARESLAAARADLDRAKSDAKAALDEANADAEAARKELERVKAAPLSNNGAAAFLLFFQQAQENVNRMQGALAKVEDPKHKEAFKKSLLTLSDAIRKAAES